MPQKTQHARKTTPRNRQRLRWGRRFAYLSVFFGFALYSLSSSAAVTIQGMYRLRTHSNQVLGDKEQYALDTDLFVENRLRNQIILDAQGTVAQNWRMTGSLNTTLSMRNAFRLQLNKADTELFIGTRAIESPAGGLLAWSRLLTGAQLLTAVNNRQLQLQLAVGAPLGIPAKHQLLGIGRPGPYLLPAQHLPLVSHSERVYVDGVLMQSELDYDIDYELGSITFATPVPFGAVIDVEYEFEAAQPRLTTIALGSWQEARTRVDFIIGQERAWAALTNTSSPEDPAWGGRIPAKQHMLGVGLAWQPFEGLQLVGTWLNTTADIQVVASHLGGRWQTRYGRAGWDYRVVPTGFAPLGAAPLQMGYRELTAGYDVQLTPHWYSKLNLMRRAELPHVGVEPIALRQMAEHVLTYVKGRGMLGWLMGATSLREAGEAHHLLSTGLLAAAPWGMWEIEAEERRFWRSGAPKPGDTFSRSRLVLTLVDTAPYRGKLEWKQESRLSSDMSSRDRIQVWQLMLGSPSPADQGMSVPDQPAWQLQGLYHIGRQKTASQEYQHTIVGYLKAHAALPLTASWAGQAWGEWRRQHDAADDNTAYALEAALRHNGVVQGEMYAWTQSYDTTPLARRMQSAAGLQVDVPLHSAWTYTGALDMVQESAVEPVERRWRWIHGLRRQHAQWRVKVDWTQGLLELPLRPSAADAEERDAQRAIHELPLGHRLGVGAEYDTPTAHAELYVARDWEAVSKTWHVSAEAVTKVGDNDLKAHISHVRRQSAHEATARSSAVITMQWALHHRLAMELKGQGDWRRSTSGQGDYQAVGVFSDWIVRF
jgi:hypothetical protein